MSFTIEDLLSFSSQQIPDDSPPVDPNPIDPKEEKELIDSFLDNSEELCQTMKDVTRLFLNPPDNRPSVLKNFDIDLPKLLYYANKATRMLNGINLSMKAIEMINAGEYDRAMSLLRQSDVECDKMLLLKPDKIRMALEKCNRNNADAILIRSYMFGNDLEGAISYLKQGLKHHPNDPHLHRFLACMLGFAQRQKEALPIMTRACELNPNEPRWLYHLAGCLRYFAISFDKKGFDDRAIETYKRYLDLVPIDDRERARACFSLAQLYWFKSSKKNKNTKEENMAEVKFYWDKGVEADENRLSCFEEVEASYHPMKTIELVLKRECYLCASCRKQKPKFKCACLAEAYCDRTCQMASWKIHKLTCQAKKA